MDDSNYNPLPPPIPDRSSRPGRAVQIQSIQCLRSEAKPNEYVDTNTITVALSTPRRPPKLCKPENKTSPNAKPNFTKDIEQQENVTNELREHLQVCKQQSKSVTDSDSQSPDIPPRSGRPPPVPPRDSKNSFKQQSRPALQRSRGVEQPSRKCNSTSEKQTNPKTTSNNANRLQPSVLIITDQPRFPQFPTSRPNRHHVTSTDLVLSVPHPVTKPPETSNVTLTLGGAGTINNTIICPDCGQCRCSDCTGDRKLPERWLCEGNCRCSADSVVNALSCMCCVKSCFKGCLDNPDGTRVNPCACTESPNCFVRWTALAALSLCLPCLCCYGPMQLGVATATACYNSSCCRKRGCNCEKD